MGRIAVAEGVNDLCLAAWIIAEGRRKASMSSDVVTVECYGSLRPRFPYGLRRKNWIGKCGIEGICPGCIWIRGCHAESRQSFSDEDSGEELKCSERPLYFQSPEIMSVQYVMMSTV